LVKQMKKLNSQQTLELKTLFLKKLGEKIKLKRNNKNISLDSLADCMDISTATLSLYENGKTDMKVSNLPLISTYCGFSISEYFDEELAKNLTETFSDLVKITKKKYQRENTRKARKEQEGVDKQLKGYIYDVDGREKYEYIPVRDNSQSLRQKYMHGIMHVNEQPFTKVEFTEFLQENGKILPALDGARKLLDYVGDAPKKETFKSSIADFILTETIIEPVINEQTKTTLRAYAYYKRMLETVSVEDNSDEPEDNTSEDNTDKSNNDNDIFSIFSDLEPLE